jgi:methionyl-tRNA formyltransferase
MGMLGDDVVPECPEAMAMTLQQFHDLLPKLLEQVEQYDIEAIAQTWTDEQLAQALVTWDAFVALHWIAQVAEETVATIPPRWATNCANELHVIQSKRYWKKAREVLEAAGL